MLERVAPELQAIHEFGVDLPEECAEFLASSLRGGIWINRCEVVRRWLQAQDHNEAYEFHKRHLQILQHGCPRRRWVLKSPVHLSSLASLLRTYPDAGIIQTHRDPADVLPSLASLLATLQSMSYGEVDPVEVGREVFEDSRHIAYTAMRERSAMNSSFVDVRYQDLVKDPLAVIAWIYETFGVSLSDEAAGRMRAFLRGNGQHKLGRHRYSLEEFGLEKPAVRDAFREYVAQYLGESAGPAIPLQ
jgi:sulfotransferase family protein